MDTTLYVNSSAAARPAGTGKRHITIDKTDRRVAVRYIAAAVAVVGFTLATILISRPCSYVFTIFYLALIVCFHKSFSIREYARNLFLSWKFWVFTALAFGLMFGVSQLNMQMSSTVFAGMDSGFIQYQTSETIAAYILNIVTFIVLRPVAENLFLRKGLLVSDNKAVMALMVFASLFLSGFMWMHGAVGILETALMALPLTVIYLLTRNVYVTLTAQLIFCAYSEIPNYVYDFARMYLQ